MRILWIKTELLHPLDKGGRIRSYQMLRSLSRQHHVTYLCLDDGQAASDALERAREYAQEVVVVPFRAPTRMSLGFFAALLRNLFSPLPYAIARYRSPELREQRDPEEVRVALDRRFLRVEVEAAIPVHQRRRRGGARRHGQRL